MTGTSGRIPTAGRTGPKTPGEFVLEALFAGLLGGSAVALFFLVIDVLNGQPYFTPSLIGSVLFQGVAAEDVTGVSLDAVASFSVLHIVAFTALGGAVSFLVHEVELHSRHPAVVLLVVFAIIEASFFLVAPLAMPGVAARLGMIQIGAANLLAAGTMALFFVLTHRAKPWQQLKHTKRELILDSLNSGVLGGSAVAVFFLVLDLMDGQALFTPALIGSVLFYGMPAEDVVAVSPDAVAYYSIAHVAAFTVLGAAMSLLVHEAELHSRHPIMLLFVLLAIIEVAFFAVAPLALPGVIARLGILRIGVANLLAASSMALFFVFAHREGAWEQLKHTTADLIFDSFYSGAIGGSAVALFFMLVDLLDGQPLFTPSLMGSVLFLGVAAEDVAKLQLNAVAYYSLVHIVSFGALGAVIAFLVHEVELHARHPLVVLFVLFAVLEVGFFFLAPLAVPGVIARLGIVRVGIANLLAAGSISIFFMVSHREGTWEKIKHAARLA